MNPEPPAPEEDTLAWWLSQVGVSWGKLASLGPDFLVISPPKTGSTWLADNLRRHPQLFVPAVKEVKYFSSFFKSLDLGWYLDQFSAGQGRLKGEVSPSYAVLPSGRIRLIHRLLPRVKLVFLMRDPVGRAWSHAKHTYRYREANFVGCDTEFAAVGAEDWRANFTHGWTLAAGDYLGQLRRWLSVFPREQLFLGFYEDLATRPEALLREVFAFLGVDPGVDLAGFPVRERVLAGLPGPLPPELEATLRGLLHGRSAELASFLREHFGLRPPPEWRTTLEGGAGPAEPFPELDDRDLSRVLAQEEGFPSARCRVLDGYRGYDITFARGRLYALAERLGPARPEDLGPAERARHEADGSLFVADSLAEVKERVDRHVFERTQARLGALDSVRAELLRARRRVARLERRLAEAGDALRRVEAEFARQRPWYRALARALRRGWRSLGSALGLVEDRGSRIEDRRSRMEKESVASSRSSILYPPSSTDERGPRR